MPVESVHFPQTLVCILNEVHSLSSQFQRQLEVFTHWHRQAYARPSHIVNRFLNNVWKFWGCNILSTLTWQIREEKSIPTLRMKEWSCRGNIPIEWTISNLGNRLFRRTDLYPLWKYRALGFFKYFHQQKSVNSLEQGKRMKKSWSTWIFYPLLPLRIFRASWLLFFSLILPN